jgi:hypothetical protein
LDHLFLGHRRDVILQHRELLDVLGRQEVRARPLTTSFSGSSCARVSRMERFSSRIRRTR